MKPSLVAISTLKRRPLIDSLFVSLRRHFALDIHKIDVKTIDDFAKITRQFDLDRHDHVLLDLPHRYLRRQCRHLQPLIDKLTIYEEDACQNYMPDSRWFGDFEHFYRQLPRLRSIHTGYYVSQRMQAAGICSTFIPKGYDANVIAPHGMLHEGVHFLPKPFSLNDLAETVHRQMV